MRGTDYVITRFANDALSRRVHRIYDIHSGQIIAEHVEPGDWETDITNVENILWQKGLPFGTKWVMIGGNYLQNNAYDSIATGIFDPTEQTITIQLHPGILPADFIVYGRITSSSVSFFIGSVTPNFVVYEATYDGAWTYRLAYTGADNVGTLWYDPGTGYLIVREGLHSGVYTYTYINPDTGAVIDSFTNATAFNNLFDVFINGYERFWDKAGYVLGAKGNPDDLPGVWILNVREKSWSEFATNSDPSSNNIEFLTGMFDAAHGLYITGYSLSDPQTEYTVHRIPTRLPQLMPLSDLIKDVLSLAKINDSNTTIEFDGFGALYGYGFVIAANATIQTSVNTLADIYDFTWCDTGSGFYFKKPGSGIEFSLDFQFTTDDIALRDPPVQSSDGADLSQPAAIEMQYISKEGDYKPRPASFSMPFGVNESIATPSFSTPVLLTDDEAQRIVTEKFFQAQEKRRTHSLMVPGENLIALVGDTASFPSGEITFTTRIEEIAVDFRNMSVELSVKDFQTEVETTITSVSNHPFLPHKIVPYSQYIHLDAPLLNYSDDLGGSGLMQYGIVAPSSTGRWTGASLYRGLVTESGSSFIFAQSRTISTLGVCTTVLPDNATPFAGDFVNSVTIRVINGPDPVSVAESSVMTGKNLCFIGAPGRWEGLGFCTAVRNADGSFTLSDLAHRGYRGTEVYGGQHQLGDIFVLISANWLHKMTHPVSDYLTRFYYRAVGEYQLPNTVFPVIRTISGAAEKPYAPVYLNAVMSSGSILLDWDYRSRLSAWEMFSVSPDCGEDHLEFEIEIMDGSLIRRTITNVLTNAYAYLFADAISDFGSIPPTLQYRVYMISDTVGRGHRATSEVITL
jgi:hypothetical protein